MSSQYDSIGMRYKSFKDLPPGHVEQPSVSRQLGNIVGIKCLDLACGLGSWSHWLIDQGAQRTVGVDISEGMIEEAKKSVPEDREQKMTFCVGDCSKPLALQEGSFDLVFAAWLLNYAPDFRSMVSMWRVIHDNLKPGGRFIGITPNTFCPMFEPFDDCYGVSVRPLEGTGEGGWKCRLTAYIEPEPVEFETYHFLHDFYERAATEAGIANLRWHPPVVPDDERKNTDFWDVYMLRPHMSVLTATRL